MDFDEKLYKLMNLNDFNGTCYYEFASGKFEDQDKCWNENSVYLTEESIIVFEDILKKINSKWDPYDCVYFDKDQILKLENELKNKIEELKNNINILTNFTKEHYIKY